jgi:hypothetical protein
MTKQYNHLFTFKIFICIYTYRLNAIYWKPIKYLPKW